MAPLQVESVFGIVPGQAEYVNSTNVATIVGNALRFYDVKEGKSRFLWGEGSGISCFAVCRSGRLIAYATKDLSPTIYVHELSSYKKVAEMSASAQVGVTAMAFTRDGKWLAVATSVCTSSMRARCAMLSRA